MAGNVKNLVYGEARGLTTEEAKEIGRAGGIASGKARQRRKMMRETLSSLLTAPLHDREMAATLEEIGLPADLQGGMILAALQKALAGDIEAARFVRDSVGEKPTETFNLAVSDKPVQAIDLSGLSDSELSALADRAEDQAALPSA